MKREAERTVWRKRNTQGVRKVALQFRKFITKASEKTDKWKLLQNEKYVFKFLPPRLIRRYMGTISCTKHIRTILDFSHDRYFLRMFLVVESFLHRTLYLSL